MLSIGAIASAAQGASYYEKDGYHAKDDPEHRDASAWFGKGAEALGLTGPVAPDTFRAILEGRVPDGSGTELGKRGRDGEITHRPGRDLTFSAPKSVSIATLVAGDERIVGIHDRAVKATLAWVEKNAVEPRMQDPETGTMVRIGKVSVAGCGPVSPMPEQLADQGQILARYDGLAGGGMARVMQAKPAELRISARCPPAMSENPDTPAFGVARKQERIGVARTEQRGDVRPRGFAERHGARAGFRSPRD